MIDIIKFIEDYYNDNLTFDQDGFTKIIDILLESSKTHKDITTLNSVLMKIMNRYQIKDYYDVMQILEYELLPVLEG